MNPKARIEELKRRCCELFESSELWEFDAARSNDRTLHFNAKPGCDVTDFSVDLAGGGLVSFEPVAQWMAKVQRLDLGEACRLPDRGGVMRVVAVRFSSSTYPHRMGARFSVENDAACTDLDGALAKVEVVHRWWKQDFLPGR